MLKSLQSWVADAEGASPTKGEGLLRPPEAAIEGPSLTFGARFRRTPRVRGACLAPAAASARPWPRVNGPPITNPETRLAGRLHAKTRVASRQHRRVVGPIGLVRPIASSCVAEVAGGANVKSRSRDAVVVAVEIGEPRTGSTVATAVAECRRRGE